MRAGLSSSTERQSIYLFFTWLLAKPERFQSSRGGAQVHPPSYQHQRCGSTGADEAAHAATACGGAASGPGNSVCSQLEQAECHEATLLGRSGAAGELALVSDGDDTSSAAIQDIPSLPASLIQKLIQDVKAADGDFQVVTIASRGFNELVTKMEVHSSVLELECSETTVIMARLFHSWLRCCGGQFKHKLMPWVFTARTSSGPIQDMDAECPRAPPKSQVRQELCNFVAAVSMEDIDCSNSSYISMEILEQMRCHAAAGRYHLLRPLLGEDESSEDGGASHVELRSWKRSDIWSDVENFWEDSYDYMVPDYYSADFPGAMRHYVEHHLAKATIVLCKDVTEPVLRTLYTWQRHHDFGSLGTADPKALESLMYCSYLHGGSNLLEATEQDLKERTYATSTDTVALVIGECQVGALVHRRIVCMDDKTSGE
ncbi:hypothetical protein SELMODRAFT_419189 [Selaginella moellendorffii]|uniref:Uncharacterized protein n=1 Tax=Selaginella moellendorffii TaxID=88036 RepID=D8S848_SELML|nr:hypothetical protein SELMODRAFT_419189 [Selaginella moellendorffii]